MRRTLTIFLALAGTAAGPAAAQGIADEVFASRPSLVFTAEELAVIQAIRDLALAPPAAPGGTTEDGAELPAAAPPVPPDIRLNALVYGGEGDWKLWVNGRRVTPGVPLDGYEILAVSRNAVDLLWQGGGESLRVRLRPNQTFVGAARRIVEGAAAATMPPELPPPEPDPAPEAEPAAGEEEQP